MDLAENLRQASKHTSNLEDFLETNTDKALQLKTITKLFYDSLKTTDDTDGDQSGDVPANLLVEDFDDEQIYQQIQLNYNANSSSMMRNLSKFISNASKLTFNVPLIDDNESETSASVDDDENNEEQEVLEDQDDEEDEGEGEDDNESDGENDDLEGELNAEAEAAARQDRIERSKNLFDDDGEEIPEAEQQSTFEKRQAKLQEKIEEIHDSMVDNFVNKPWQLRGEVNAKTRPQESLIEEYLQFDHTTKQMPLNTEELTKKIESLIKTRIKDRAYDDVERKIRPVDQPMDYKKAVQLNHEKSKQSLSQIYEKEYLDKAEEKTTGEKVEKTNPIHDEIRLELQSLFVKLDALSNFHFRPRPQINDFKITSNIATISVENVAPVHVSNANMLAPTEIQENINKLPKTKEEKSKAEKKRDYKGNRAKKSKKLKMKNGKMPAKKAGSVDLKNVKKLSDKPGRVDSNATLQVFNPTSKRKAGKSDDDVKAKKSKKSPQIMSSKRLKI